MCELLLDTDVLIKLSAYGLFDAISHPGCASDCDQGVGLVGAAAFVARKRMAVNSADPASALANLEHFLSRAVTLEPTNEELAMAADLEEAATRDGLALDVGESQLCAIAALRGQPVVLTGDKRAIVAVEALLTATSVLRVLVHRVACMEQAMMLAVQRLGALAVRARVIAERAADKTMSICFSVTARSVPSDFNPDGLSSYIGDLRASAPSVLLPGDVLRAR